VSSCPSCSRYPGNLFPHQPPVRGFGDLHTSAVHQGATQQAQGWDFRLGGRIATLDKVTPGSGLMERYHQITFELVERGSGAIIWSNMYEFEKFDRMDTIYR